MTGEVPVGYVPAAQAWTAGPQLTGVQQTVAKLHALLGGRLDVQDGVSLETRDNVINMQLRLVGNVIQLTFFDPKPLVNLHYIVSLQRHLDGVRIYDDRVEIDIPGLPNPTFPIVS